MAGIAGTTQTSLRVPSGVLDRLDRVAAALDRDRSWVMLLAIRQFLDGEGADVLREAEGVASLDRGEGHDFDDVQAEAAAIVAQARAARSAKVG